MQLSHYSIILISNTLTHIKKTVQSYTQQAFNKDFDRSLCHCPVFRDIGGRCWIVLFWLLWYWQQWRPSIVVHNVWGMQERRKTGRRRQETEEGGNDYQMRRWRSWGQHLNPDKGEERKREVPSFSTFTRECSASNMISNNWAPNCPRNAHCKTLPREAGWWAYSDPAAKE